MHQQNSNSMRRGRRSFTGAAGIAMILMGLVLVGAVGAYYGYSSYARSQLDSLIYSPVESAGLVPVSTAPLPSARLASQSSGVQPSRTTSVQNPLTGAPPNIPGGPETVAFPVSSYSSVYPGTQIHPKYWDQPIWSGGEPYSYNANETGTQLPPGFRAVSPGDGILSPGQGSATTRISVPSIGVDSDIKELEILDLGNSREYETPKNTVGHIPQSPNPGEQGNAWFFGHLESPIRGEGNVFQRLPDIPEKLRNGDEVLVELQNEEGHIFLYRVTRTDVVHQDDMRLYGSEGATITLVACVPSLVYDHRILVTADLIGVNEG